MKTKEITKPQKPASARFVNAIIQEFTAKTGDLPVKF
jgi:hypothetical protein